jgi:hypothetical protein
LASTEKRGTELHFMADEEIFGQVEFHYEIIAKRLRELSFLNNGVKIRLIDQRTGKEENFAFLGGVRGFVEYINRTKSVLHPNIFHAAGESLPVNGPISVEVAMQWNDSYAEQVLCFTNNIPQADGGTHMTGLRAAMTRVINRYIEENEIAKKAKVDISRRRHAGRPGLCAVGEDARPEVCLADQDEAGVVGGTPGGRGGGGGETERVSSGAAARRQGHHRQDRRSGTGTRCRSQSEGDDASQGLARRRRVCPASWPIARRRIRRFASCTWSRVIPPEDRRSRVATGSSRRSCR